MTPEQKVARLHRQMGGYAAAEALGAHGRKERARKGGEAVLEKYGASHMKKLNAMRQLKRAKREVRANHGSDH